MQGARQDVAALVVLFSKLTLSVSHRGAGVPSVSFSTLSPWEEENVVLTRYVTAILIPDHSRHRAQV